MTCLGHSVIQKHDFILSISIASFHELLMVHTFEIVTPEVVAVLYKSKFWFKCYEIQEHREAAMQHRKMYLFCLPSARCILSPVKHRLPKNPRILKHGVGFN